MQDFCWSPQLLWLLECSNYFMSSGHHFTVFMFATFLYFFCLSFFQVPELYVVRSWYRWSTYYMWHIDQLSVSAMTTAYCTENILWPKLSLTPSLSLSLPSFLLSFLQDRVSLHFFSEESHIEFLNGCSKTQIFQQWRSFLLTPYPHQNDLLLHSSGWS